MISPSTSTSCSNLAPSRRETDAAYQNLWLGRLRQWSPVSHQLAVSVVSTADGRLCHGPTRALALTHLVLDVDDLRRQFACHLVHVTPRPVR
jgi:hypothetical protein